MDVILLERIESLGQMGEVVKVKPGYARNYLLPQKKALRATKENREYFETQRSQLEAQNLDRRQDAEKISGKLDGLMVIIIRQAGEFGQLYGSVSTRDIATAITGAGFTVDRRQILLDVPIKTLGLHKTRVSLHPEVTVSVTVNVAPTEEEAAAQAAGKTAAAPEALAPVEETAAAAAPAEPAGAPAAEEPAAAKEPKKKKTKAKKAADAE
ncbi:MAG TPA: 50S ribosomal protein L9 [Alphaproteobacteria bacterium]